MSVLLWDALYQSWPNTNLLSSQQDIVVWLQEVCEKFSLQRDEWQAPSTVWKLSEIQLF